MSRDDQDTVDIQIEVGATLAPFATSDRVRALEDRVASNAEAFLETLGFDTDANVAVQVSDAGQAIRLRINGALQPYPPELLRRTWLAVAPPALWSLQEKTQPRERGGFPEDWFREHVASLGQSTDAAAWDMVGDFVARVTHEIMQARAAAVAGPAQVDAYLRSASRELPAGAALPPRRLVQPTLQTLIAMGVWPTNRQAVLRAIADEPEERVEDAIETAFVQLRSKRIEIHVNPDYLGTLVRGAPEGSVYTSGAAADVHEMFRVLEDGMFVELGLSLPGLVWVHAPELPDRVFSVRINDRMGLPTLGLRAGELLVNDTVDRLREKHGVDGRRTRNPASGYENAVVPEAKRAELEAAGLTTWTPSGFVVLALASEIRRCAAGLLAIDDVEYSLSVLELAFPETVFAALVRMTFGDITRVLRALLAEGISIRDLRSILERLPQYETVPADPAREVVFDDRLAIGDSGQATQSAWRQHVEFVRSGLKHQIAHKYARGTDTLLVYLLDPRIEQVLAERPAAPSPSEHVVDEVERERILQAVWSELSFLPPAAMTPSILTLQTVRAALRDVVATECPGLSILSFQELPPELNIQPVARINYVAPIAREGAGA